MKNWFKKLKDHTITIYENAKLKRQVRILTNKFDTTHAELVRVHAANILLAAENKRYRSTVEELSDKLATQKYRHG